ncbi:nitronate monooxygenase [Gordonia rubripertincta]|uniref:Propionate 3-nitronate monooxygenase n=2 Tax=Gordonia rubripertincta TaxID=36822 RepID=A0ABT4MS30_GORRU|nr:nitronate monooxygenase [Gordonia rubripertincta]MCZ4549829.1 nitronate monooxygenase [Gordonia rubripertincta]
MTMFDLRGLDAPIVGAPMAGGPSTPALAAAVSNAGGLGFLAGALLGAEKLAADIDTARTLTTGPLGVNLFVPQSDTGRPAEIAGYADELAQLASQFEVELGEPRYTDDDYPAKVEVLLDLRPEVVSFTFGCASADDIARLRAAGITTVATVTTEAETEIAKARGVEAFVAQGPGAGGHRGTFDPLAQPATDSLDVLLAAVLERAAVVVAAGGIGTPEEVERVMGLGAVAAQVGTALLLSDEAGTNPVSRAALQDAQFTETAVTKAFSGRYARGLRNRFVDDHDQTAPLAYPQIHYLTGPLRRAAVQAGDAHATNHWAGTGFRNARPGAAAAIVEALSSRVRR